MSINQMVREELISSDKDFKIIRVSSGVIIRKNDNDEDELLLIRRSQDDRWPNKWETPKGRCNAKEDYKKCLIREVKEETNLDIEVLSYIGEFEYRSDKKETLAVVDNFYCKPKDPKQEVIISDEHSEFKWVTSMSEVQLMTEPEVYKIVSLVFNKDKSIVNNDTFGFTVKENIERYLRYLNK